MTRSMWWAAALIGLLGMSAVTAAAQEADDSAADPGEASARHRSDHERDGGMGMGLGRPGGRLGARLIERLDLSKEQRDKLAELRDREQRKAIETRAELEVARLDLRKLMREDEPSRTAIEAQIDRAAALRAQLAKGRIGTMLELRSMLTDEQRKKLDELRRAGPPARPGRMRAREMRRWGRQG